MPDFMIPLDSSDSGSESDVSSEDSGSAHGLLNRGNVSQVIDRNRIADLLEQGRLDTVALHDVGVAKWCLFESRPNYSKNERAFRIDNSKKR